MTVTIGLGLQSGWVLPLVHVHEQSALHVLDSKQVPLQSWQLPFFLQ
jgi:hypothetical protein